MQLYFRVNSANLMPCLHYQLIDVSQQLGAQKRNVVNQSLTRILIEIKFLAAVPRQLPQWRVLIGKSSKTIKIAITPCLQTASTTMPQ